LSDGNHRRPWVRTGGIFAGVLLAISTIFYGAASNLISDIALDWWHGRDSTELAVQQSSGTVDTILAPASVTVGPIATATILPTVTPVPSPTATATPDNSCRDSATGRGILFPDDQVFGQEWANPSWWAQGQYLESTGVSGETVPSPFTLSALCSNLIEVTFAGMNYASAVDGAGLIFYLLDAGQTQSMAIGLSRRSETGDFDQIVLAVNEDVARQSWIRRDCVSVPGIGSDDSITLRFRVTQTGVQVINNATVVAQFIFAPEIGSAFSPATVAMSSRFENTRITRIDWVVEGVPEGFPISIAGSC